MSLLRYTKEKINQDIIEVDVWERTEYFFQDDFNKLIGEAKCAIILFSVGIIAFLILVSRTIRS